MVSFKDTAGGGGGDEVVGDALDLHFGAREERVVAGDFEVDTVFLGKGVDLMASCWHFAAMPTLTIRNLPEDLHAALKERARKNRRSLNQEVISILDGFSDSSDEGMHLKESLVRPINELD